ncbi:MAG TPA: hypothetical protein VEK15_19275 [Vicinamibacteria bacterium]|nr:hypothetical protein [Vicinamibacteria bacterium]
MPSLLLLVSLLAQPVDSSSLTPLELELVSSHHASGAEEERATHKLYLVANGTRMTTLRSGREVAVSGADGVQYRNVGLNLQGRASQTGERFRIHLKFERSALGDPDAAGNPTFLTFSSQSEIWASDGETIDVAAGPDPGTGARWSLRVTVRVLER